MTQRAAPSGPSAAGGPRSDATGPERTGREHGAHVADGTEGTGGADGSATPATANPATDDRDTDDRDTDHLDLHHPEDPTPATTADTHPVPPAMRATAAWSWRILVVAGVVLLLAQAVALLNVVVLPFVAAIFLTAALVPVTTWLQRRGVPRGLAAAATVVGFLVVVIGAFFLVGRQVISGTPELVENAAGGLGEIRTFLVDLGVPAAQLEGLGERLGQIASENSDRLTRGALTTATLAAETITGVLLAFFSFIFLLYDGAGVWRWITGLVPRRGRHRFDVSGRRAWTTLTGYVRGTVIVALVDAVLIGVVLLVLRVPLAVPLAVLVFFGAFIPLVGATLTAILAALVALVTQGPVVALLVIAGIIAVQQIEGHVLQPFLLGRLVRLHPLAVVLAIGVGAVVAGIGGAVVAVPIAAVANTVGLYLSGRVPDAASAGAEGRATETGDPVTREEARRERRERAG